MTLRTAAPTNKESEFDISELFFSRTDRNGTILSGNGVFVRVSGYEADELVGKPHSIIRHPDMPKAIFQLFWEYLKRDQPVAAYVKNMSKNGNYYWVMAMAMPAPSGYISIRIKPSHESQQALQKLYGKLKELEAGSNLEVARQELTRTISTLGFENYDDFMTKSIVQELIARESQLTSQARLSALALLERALGQHPQLKSKTESCRKLAKFTREVFFGFKDILTGTEGLLSAAKTLSASFQDLKPIVMNLMIAAAKLRSDGSTLNTIAESFQTLASDLSRSVSDFESVIKSLMTSVKESQIRCIALYLQAETYVYFNAESVAGLIDSSKQTENWRENNRELLELSRRYAESAEASLADLTDILQSFAQNSARFAPIIAGLKVILLRARIEATATNSTGNFLDHLVSMGDFIDRVKIPMQDMVINCSSLLEHAAKTLLLLRETSTVIHNESRELT